MKILVVDDEKNILKLYQAELEDEGYTVVTANSGEDGLSAFEKEDPDLVTLDILMPDMDGIQVLRQMKEKKPNIPVIMLTAYDYRDDFSVWVADAYIVKSSDTTNLKATIKQVLEGKK
ncbi:response regulator [Thermodesulfovibrionales bacterium]|nr:response regulator [Thermodesulfovibrionales bacterium]MCL0030301.1 response regulator [Thermodesulfovibrionales bacterium]MCL0033289.1 response regulator [Thermodesulfovibrionales bacterium]MCL0035471.1 response regulator [Thermodesulfovibrionales bacterium]MCL0037717.1 response regulator [Thermodesulfovibrionales bacterium]